MVYRTPERFVAALREIAEQERTHAMEPVRALPELPDLRLALGVAAADLRPLVVVHATDDRTRRTLREALEDTAWSEAFVGRLRYVVLDDAEELEEFDDLELRTGVTVVQPEAFGRGGTVLAHAEAPIEAEALTQLLTEGVATFDAADKHVRDHLRRGEREGIEWEPAVEVSDPGPGR